MSTKATRVGFVLSEQHWLGGVNYLRNLFAAIHALPSKPIVPVVFTSSRDASCAFPGVQVVRSRVLSDGGLTWFFRRLIARAVRRDVLLRNLLRREGVSILSHSFQLGRQWSIRTIGWIPDFQHIHLPEFFSARERRRRDREFLSICRNSDAVVVSSACAQKDLLLFFPMEAHKARVLRFVAVPPDVPDSATLANLRRRYEFDRSYFLLPNQFWAHKNHEVVVRALKYLKDIKKPLLVLATGPSTDYRNPSFFASLMKFAAECEVLDYFRVLGQVPLSDLAGLMRYATAILNPSLFEGWSTSVEEAKSMGKQVVLSDIPVHREQSPERGFFFPPRDARALAEAMLAAEHCYQPEQDSEMQEKARAAFPDRQRAFAADYEDIVQSLVHGGNREAAKRRSSQ